MLTGPDQALPVVTYDDPVTLHLDGETVRLLPQRHAHTDGDTLLQFTKHDVLAVGDKVAALVAHGKTVDEVIAAKPTAEFDAQVPQGAQNLERFLKWLYAELKAGRG